MGGTNRRTPRTGMEIKGKYGTYKLVEDIGGGGNGRVFSVEVVDPEKHQHLPEREEFVIKILKTRSRPRREQKKREKRFEREIKTVCKIQKEIEGIIPIYDASCFLEEQSGFAWYLMPRALDYNFKKGFSTEEKLKNMKDIGACIVQLHKRDLVHRDIKPKNLLIYNNRVCLADFGLVRNMDEIEEHITDIHDDMGPMAIRPPEMRNIENPNKIDYKKSDVYLFAKTVWIVLTGVGEGFYEEYKRSEKRIYLDKKKLRVETAEPLHEMLESATRHYWWDRIDISECVRHIDDQLSIIAKRVSDVELGKWKYIETTKEICGAILPDIRIYQGMQSVLEILERLAGRVNLVFQETGKVYEPMFFYSVKILSENLFELYIKNTYGNRRKIVVDIEKISMKKSLSCVLNTKIMDHHPDNVPLFTNLSKAFQSTDNQICISGIYSVQLVRIGILSDEIIVDPEKLEAWA